MRLEREEFRSAMKDGSIQQGTRLPRKGELAANVVGFGRRPCQFKGNAMLAGVFFRTGNLPPEKKVYGKAGEAYGKTKSAISTHRRTVVK